MLKDILNLLLEQLHYEHKKGSSIENKVLQIVEEIDELEDELAEAIADAERFGDINDNSHWRTVEVNRIKRIIEAKKGMINTLRNI